MGIKNVYSVRASYLVFAVVVSSLQASVTGYIRDRMERGMRSQTRLSVT